MPPPAGAEGQQQDGFTSDDQSAEEDLGLPQSIVGTARKESIPAEA